MVLHDVTDLEHSVIAITPTNLTGRAIGSPVTNLLLKTLKIGKNYHKDYLINYEGVAADGKKLRSSTLFIRDDDGEIIGMLCININCKKFDDMLAYLSKFATPAAQKQSALIEKEHLSPSIKELAASSIREIINGMNVPPERMSQEEKMEVVRQLNDNGVFLLKGVVTTVASELNASEASIYRYLGKMKNADKVHLMQS
ncbi:MAG: PAS domain-containing protein [Sporolactobacillus sp.]